MRYILCLLCLPGPAFAAMNAEEFEAYVAGQTLTYADDGVIYGIEEYLPNRRVRWSYIGDECREGYWYEAAGEICFVYDHEPDRAQCWLFDDEDGRLRATHVGAENERELYVAQRSNEPLICLGPNVGV